MDFMTTAFSSGDTSVAPVSSTQTAVPVDTGVSTMNVSDVLSGSVQALGALAQYRAGEINAAATSGEARMASERAGLERVKGMQEANDARDRLVRALAQQNAAASVSGVSLNSSGSLERGREVLIQEGERGIDTIRSNAKMSELVAQGDAANLRASARSTQLAGRAGLGTGLLGAYDRINRRGTVPKAKVAYG